MVVIVLAIIFSTSPLLPVSYKSSVFIKSRLLLVRVEHRFTIILFTPLQPQLPQLKMMEVENRIEETFSGQVEELPDDLKERRVHGNHHANGNGNGVILEESEDEDLGEAGMEKAPTDPSQAIAGRVIKKVCVLSSKNMLEQ